MSQPLILAAAGGRENMPKWLTQEYFEKCMADEELQKNWSPRVGDWYFCVDLYKILEIEDLEKYYSEGKTPPLKSDHGKDSRGHWECDIYVPEPS